jgi:hypothetical protein
MNVPGKKSNPGIENPKSLPAKRMDDSSSITPANSGGPLSIIGSHMGSGPTMSAAAAKRK